MVVRSLDAAAYPHDRTLIDAQGHLMLTDEVLAAVARTTGLPLDDIFFTGYLLSLAVIWAGLVLVGQRIYQTPWAIAALGAAFTLRHRIPKTSANSFEPYFHPRMLAFGLGLLALAAFLRRRHALAIALVAIVAFVHVTTGLWFAILIGVALVVVQPRLRMPALVAAAAGVIALGWALGQGAFSGLVRMDDVWLQAVSSKDSLFATGWPAWAWAANLALLPVLWWAHRRRAANGTASVDDFALAIGATALVAVFLITLPAVAARLSFPVQLQISRIFWPVDFLATAYLLAALIGVKRKSSTRTIGLPAAVALTLVAVSAGRGAYILTVEHPERSLFDVHLTESPWEDAMRWLATQPAQSGVLADPGHGWKYGTSVRVSARRDVYLEDVKDSAIAIYSRDVAVRVVERTNALGDFAALTADRATDLARRYDLDWLVTTAELPLPVAYRNSQFAVYALRQTH